MRALGWATSFLLIGALCGLSACGSDSQGTDSTGGASGASGAAGASGDAGVGKDGGGAGGIENDGGGVDAPNDDGEAGSGCVDRPFQTEPTSGGSAIYVSPSGDDSGDGSLAHPLATIQEGLARATPGSVIRLLPGRWQTTFVVEMQASEAQPLTIEGTRNSCGEWLSIVDGSTALDATRWEPAPTVGPNTYSIDEVDIEDMLIDGKIIRGLNRYVADRKYDETRPPADPIDGTSYLYTAAEVFMWDDEHIHDSLTLNAQVPVWTTIRGAYNDGNVLPGKTVIRLIDGSSPADHEIRVGTSGAVIGLANSAYVTVKALQVMGGKRGIEIRGKQALGNTVDECSNSTGERRISVNTGAKHTRIINNQIGFEHIGHPTGTWGGHGDLEGAEKLEALRRGFIYEYFKYWATSRKTSDDVSIELDTGAEDTLVENNALVGGLRGIVLAKDVLRTRVIGNRVQDFSSVGTISGTLSSEILFDRNFLYNNNKNLRLHEMNADEPVRHIDVIRNVFMQPPRLGDHVFHHINPIGPTGLADYPPHEVRFVHNTFIGGKNGMTRVDLQYEKGTPAYVFVNNRFIEMARALHGSVAYGDELSDLGGFDFNQVLAARVYTHAGSKPEQIPWYGRHNIFDLDGPSGWTWDEHTYEPPAPTDDPAWQKGVDVSQVFVIDHGADKSYDAIPGFLPGYFDGAAPTPGAPIEELRAFSAIAEGLD